MARNSKSTKTDAEARPAVPVAGIDIRKRMEAPPVTPLAVVIVAKA